jgi:hypothetical protein
MLGSELYTNTQAKLLGKALPIVQWLDPVEREILVLLEEPLPFPELLALAQRHNLDKETVCAAVGSLLRRGLVLLTSVEGSSTK